jgi:Ca-activated chloride channel family protein
MTFRSGSVLWLLIAVPPMAVLLVMREQVRQGIGRRLVAERLRGMANAARSLRPALLVIALAAAIVAWAGPQRGFTMMAIESREANRIVVVDVSQSMASRDVGTSRLMAAKAIAKNIVHAFPGRAGLVVFEEEAEVMSPLTTDTEAVIALLDTIEPGEMAQPGTDVGLALVTALRLLDGDPSQKADVVILSDGEDQGARLEDAIRRAKARGVAVNTILIGSTGGSTIPLAGTGGELRDASGATVTTYAHPEILKSIAGATGGRFYENPFGAHQLDGLAASTTAGASKVKELRAPIDRYQWPLALALAAFFLGSLANRGAD